jgi:oligopeptide/dipeptide ABC transporter ATP-binding protein
MSPADTITEPEARLSDELGDAPLLSVEHLKTQFFTSRGVVRAVDDVSFTLRAGETLGVLGESGSGKSVTALSILRLVPSPAGRIMGGRILLNGEDILRVPDSRMRQIRGKLISMILQDPLTSLNPVFTVGDQIAESLRIHQPGIGRLKERVLGLLKRVGIPDAERRLDSYPHQFSGGMRQRAVGAISIASEPKLLIADEPTTSLDVTIQAQYLRLLKDLQKQSNLAILFITHDLGVAARVCDRVAVMYCGRIVEEAAVRDLFDEPAHPYTRGLIGSLPKLDRRVDRLTSIPGQPPQLHDVPPGCPFAPRCSDAMDICSQKAPPEIRKARTHRVACWLHADDDSHRDGRHD